MNGGQSGAFDCAVAAIDAANAADPNSIVVAGQMRPKELAHAEFLTAWVARLLPEPSEALLLAARAHHIRRWTHPRSEQPAGRSGYLRWRTALYRFHAEQTAGILRECGYGEELISRVAALVGKQALGQDGEARALEDGLCLVFMETQFDELAARLDHDKMVDVVRKTWRKMSADGRSAALTLPLSPATGAIVRAATTET